MVTRQPFESKPTQGEDGLESLRSTQSRQALRRSWQCLAAFVLAGVVAVLCFGVILGEAFGDEDEFTMRAFSVPLGLASVAMVGLPLWGLASAIRAMDKSDQNPATRVAAFLLNLIAFAVGAFIAWWITPLWMGTLVGR